VDAITSWSNLIQEKLLAVGSATIADAVIFLIAATSLLAVLYLMRLGKGATSSPDAGLRGKLDRVETLLNEIRSERLRAADESKRELESLKASIDKLLPTAS
jgi:hypothetical protein